jgi:hypothetical protein
MADAFGPGGDAVWVVCITHALRHCGHFVPAELRLQVTSSIREQGRPDRAWRWGRRYV